MSIAKRLYFRHSFTIFELLIVVLIMVIVYGLVFGYFQRKVVSSAGYLDLRSVIENLAMGNLPAQIICTDAFGNCYLKTDIYSGSSNLEELPNPLNIPKDSEVFRLKQNELVEYIFPSILGERRQEKEVNIEFTLYPNKSSTEMVIKTDDDIIVYRSIYPPQKVKNLNEAVELLKNEDIMPTSSGDYY